MPETLAAIFESLPYVLEGSAVTVGVVLGAMLAGLMLGVPAAVGQVYGPPSVRALVGLYVWFFRGVPILVQLFLFYFGLFAWLEIDLSAFSVAVVVLGLTSGAYQSQIFRGAIETLPPGQMKAALALGMSRFTAIRTIILPQALRLSIPGWSNEYSILLKDSAVTFVLGVPEIMARTHFVATRTYRHLPLYLTSGLIYLILTLIGVKALLWLEKRTRIRGYAQKGSI